MPRIRPGAIREPQPTNPGATRPCSSKIKSPSKIKAERRRIFLQRHGGTCIVVTIAVVSGALCFWIAKPASFFELLSSQAVRALPVLPRVVGAMVLAGCVMALLPWDRIRLWMGGQPVVARLLIATVTGAITLGGPMTMFPLASAMVVAGIDIATTTAYVSAAILLNVNRALIWEIPLLGADFLSLRYLVCLPLPFVIGLVVHWIATFGRAAKQGARPS